MVIMKKVVIQVMSLLIIQVIILIRIMMIIVRIQLINYIFCFLFMIQYFRIY